jgi:hypothetical protein
MLDFLPRKIQLPWKRLNLVAGLCSINGFYSISNNIYIWSRFAEYLDVLRCWFTSSFIRPVSFVIIHNAYTWHSCIHSCITCIFTSIHAWLHFLIFINSLIHLSWLCWSPRLKVGRVILSSRLSAISRKCISFLKIPHWVHPSWKKVASVVSLSKYMDRKIPSRVHSSLGIESCLTISLQLIPGSSSDPKAASGIPVIWIACINAKYIFNFLQWRHPQCAWSKDVTKKSLQTFPHRKRTCICNLTYPCLSWSSQ